MKHNDKGITDEQFLQTFANLFDEVAENDDRDVDVQLRELGYDPVEVAEKARAFVKTIFPDCQHEWQSVYYGTECTKCKLFYVDGQEPWLPT